MKSCFLLGILILFSCTFERMSISSIRSLRNTNINKVLFPRKLRQVKLKGPMENIQETTEQQAILFKNVMNKIKLDDEKIEELKRLAEQFNPIIKETIDGVKSQITEVGASLDAYMQKAGGI